MATDNSTKTNPNAQILQELEALSETLYKTHTSARRTASLVLPRTSIPSIPFPEDETETVKTVDDSTFNKPRPRRMSLSPWKPRPKLEVEDVKAPLTTQSQNKKIDEKSTSSGDKKGVWNWKPIRALSHIGMQKLSCLFSVEVVTAQGLPSSMNGLRLSVCVRKKETKDGAVKTMPSRVAQGAADFEETLFVRCHVYTSNSGGKYVKFEPRPFWIYLFAVDAKELEFGRNSVDLSELISESIEKNQQGTRVRQWDTSYSLFGKAKGGELVLKLGFQIMEKDGKVDIYNSEVENSKSSRLKNLASSLARKQSKSSFSMASPRITSRNDAWSPSKSGIGGDDIQGMDDLNLDDPNPVQDPSSSTNKLDETKEQVEDFDLPDFEVVDKGVEVLEKKEEKEEDEAESEKSEEVKSASSEVVKEIVHDHLHLNRLSELDSIAQQIKALETMMGEDSMRLEDEDTDSQRLDADEETVTMEFLQLLEGQESTEYLFNQTEIPPLQLEGKSDYSSEDKGSKVYLADLGKGLGCVVQTKDGGYLASMNPLDIAVDRNETPKLAMQISKPFVLALNQPLSGFELFQKLASIGLDELSSQVSSLMPIDEIIGKTAEQVAFEGIASAIIQGRNKEGASSSAARIVSTLKSMANVMSSGRKERISTGLWNVDEDPLTAENLLAFTMQKIESMTVEALKVQVDMAEEEAPFDVSALNSKNGDNVKDLLASAISLEDWIKDHSHNNKQVRMILVVQLRDPVRRYEAVGGPVMVLIHATSVDTNEETRFKVISMHVGGFKVRNGTKKHAWDNEKQRLTAMQWLVAYGLGKAEKKRKQTLVKGQDLLWSISSRIVAEMWLKTIRNPNVKIVM
ncbi:hypothetical protein TanjilG_21948 [Lupinus angustifolius]|uniref:C2 NT-type domain-containing protein n=1 Tax=Lupinus angustifolius TaxID=3871 RepID=A0A1J7HB77_LUPAN|nr:PREDICTED: protein PLASTID MOVEMENT IMPAIRED 1 isoform X1 [Lupinus angustifolius]OIW10111.1 hypothetical protein TanjilG_21948 [Lupinus angustifolius]